MKTLSRIIASIMLMSVMACGRNARVQPEKGLVTSLTNDFTTAYNSGDLSKLMKSFANDAIVISCGWRMCGKDSIAGGMKYMLEHSSGIEISECISNISGDIVFLEGLVTLNWKNESYKAVAKGAITLIWKKQSDGSWKITFEEENHGDIAEK
jgi:ketosteroid isomerase-like protein